MTGNTTTNGVLTSHKVEGAGLNAGIGLGRVVLHQPGTIKTMANGPNLKGSAKKSELAQLDDAFSHMVDEIQALVSRHSTATSQENFLDILNVYLLLANDPGWKRQLREKIHSGASAMDAVDQTLISIRAKLGAKGKSSIWQERISDFEDISLRLKRHLLNKAVLTKERGDFPIVVIADRIGTAELLDYNREHLTGLVLSEYSHTSHAAIVARSLGIPVVGGIQDILGKITPGDFVLVDGNEGNIYIRPSQKTIRHFGLESSFKKMQFFQPSLKAIAPLPSQTRDGVSIRLLLNAGLVEDVSHIAAAGAEGIGLYRTEIPFMMRSTLPNVAEQTKLYLEILKRAGNYPVVFRTLDVGGDKVLPYLERLKPRSSTVWKRATRDHPILLRYQLRALIRASGGCELTIMLPMVAEAREVEAVRELLNREMDRERKRGNVMPAKVRLGAMIEVPSLVFQLPQIFPHVDFLSVGSNDLFQFFYAIDRKGYPKLSDRHDVLTPTFLNVLKSIQDQCKEAQIPLSICGEMAGRPLEALALIGLGYRTLSMSASSVPTIKALIRNLSCQEISDYMSTICTHSQGSIRQSLSHFAKDRGIYSP